jgi:hypothetical protein
MKCKRFYWIVTFIWLLGLACAKGPSGEKDILTTVNDFKLTLSEFQTLLAADMDIDRDLKITDLVKKEYLNQIIQKQILIQEAKRLKFDQKPKFIRTIQRYWEATLIRDLMESRGQEIEKKTIVTQDEVELYYNEMKKKDPALQPLQEIDQALLAKIREEKKTAMFQKWVEELKRAARIHTNEELLNNIR